MFREQKNRLKLTKAEFNFWRDMCRKSKNLFNATLWETNQHFERCGEFLTYNSAYHVMKDKLVFKSIPTDPGGQTMKVVERCFRSFFGLLKKRQQGNYNKPVKHPRYLPKDGYFLCIFPRRAYQYYQNYFTVNVPKDMQYKYKFKKLTYPIPPNIKGKRIKEIRILPRNKATYFEIEFIYEVQKEEKGLDKNRYLSIDPGVNNFATCLDSETGSSFILDGRKMKSINQWYNKEKARLQKVWSKQAIKPRDRKKLNIVTNKRNRRMQEFLNQYVNFIVQVCLKHKIGNVVIGEGWHAQENSNIGDKNNQNFVMLPFGKFAWKIRYKCELYGIEFKTINESYTSKCDHLANEPMCHQEKYLGKRSPRGLFKSSTGKVLNADLNGALGILLKTGMGEALRGRLSSGTINVPSRIRLDKIQQTSCVRLAEDIFG